VGFIEPVVNNETRTVRVRVILNNEQGRLKPGMFAQALVRVAIMPDGTPAPTGLEGKFACPMHPYVVSDGASDCRVCQMPLEKIPGQPVELMQPPQVLAVPADAVLTTGRRQLVYVDRGGVYELVEPRLGPRAGDYFPVLDGLKAGDRVVNRGNFLLDSQFQISGKPSLLYPEGMAGGESHKHDAAGGKSSEAEKIDASLAKLSADDKALALAQQTCPVSGMGLGSMGTPIKVSVSGRDVFLCCPACSPAVKKDPAAILEKLPMPTTADEAGDP
jgi:Cu(I)/Ag(I) efflux system membrane fusion protein